jgi:hypothetical protein
MSDYDTAVALSRSLGDQTIADILAGLLGCDENEQLTDSEALAGDGLFDELCRLRPDCVGLAQRGQGLLTGKECAGCP